MGRRYDDRRWIENPDGSFSRRTDAATAISEAAGVAVEEKPDEEKSDTYYEDLNTTGAAAELAAELGVDLSQVKGTGKNGRITKGDVEAAAE